MASSPMRTLIRWRRLKVYWADRSHFVKPGVHVWLGPRFGNLRVLPVPRRRRGHR